jgi:hypothetical protein
MNSLSAPVPLSFKKNRDLRHVATAIVQNAQQHGR